MPSDQPLFDDVRKALAFAMNAPDVRMPKPAMTTAMVSGVKSKARRGKAKQSREELEEQRRQEYYAAARAAFRRPDGTRRLDETERAAQAGFILQEFAALEPIHQSVLTGRVMQSHRPCNCRRPCCSGWAVNLRWAKAVEDLCLMLKDGSDAQRTQGRRGFSTQPQLRREVVMGFLRSQEPQIVDLARIAECSTVTAAKHRAWIVEFLQEQEDVAWQRIAALLDQAGIVGAFTD